MIQRSNYCSFLVRMWRPPSGCADPGLQAQAKPGAAEADAAATWLLQIEHIPGGEKQYFASLEDLFAFMRAFAEERNS